MAPIKRKPLVMGTDRKTGHVVQLKHDWLETHVQMVGPPGTGKTRLLLWLFMVLSAQQDATVILMNPKGSLFRMARDWAIAMGYTKRLVLFDPSEQNAIIGYNPLAANGLAIATHAKAVKEAIRSAWGQSSFDQTPQLARFLFLVLAVARELGLTLIDTVQLIRPRSLTRRRALRDLSPGPLWDALAYFDSMNEQRQEELAASTLARLEPFIFDETIRRMVMQQNRVMSLDAVIGGNKILLVNLEQFRPLRTDDVKLMGRFLMNDILAHVFARPEHRRSPVYLIMDEVQTFATQDLCTALDQGRELGLHCVMAHQHPSQLIEEDQSRRLPSSVMNCARTKVLFGGIAVEELETLAKEVFIDEFDPYTVKDELTHLELEPIESRRLVLGGSLSLGRSSANSEGKNRSGSYQKGWSHAAGMSHTNGGSFTTGSSDSESSSSGTGVSVSPDGTIVQSTTETTGGGHAFSESSTDSFSTTHSEVDSESESTGQQIGEQVGKSNGTSAGIGLSATYVPFYEYKKRQVVSSRTFLSEAEFLTLALQKLRLQPRGHFALKVPGKRAVFLRAPLVKEPWLSDRARDRALEQIYSQPYYSSPQQIADEETNRRERLSLAAPEKGDTIEGHHSNDEVRFTRPRKQVKKSQSLQLTERDRRVLDFFPAIRFAATSHFAGALVPEQFPTEEKLRRRLRKLALMGFLDRPARRISPERLTEFEVVGEERPRGRPEDIWALAQRGADILRLPGDWNKNNGRLRSSAFPHRLMISRVYSTLMLAASRGLISVDQWLGENAWRGRVAVDGESLPLIPDGVFIISDQRSDAEAMVFLETDNSTEPLRRTTMAQSSFFKKIAAYWQYWNDEIRPRRETMLVFTVAKTPERAEALRLTAKTVDEKGRGLNLFWFTHEPAWEIGAPRKFLYEPIWTTAGGERRALFEI